jgi:hypothetical protein
MIEFVCDSCGAIKQTEDAWILGRAAEAIALTAARREVTLFAGWDRERAVQPLAVHFCSLECKNKYMKRLFGPDATADEVVVERTVPATSRSAAVEERVVTEIEPRRRRPQRKAA